jgi:adenosylhomocysteine nucleosidase
MTETPVAFVIAMMEEAEGVFDLPSWTELSLAPFPVYRRGDDATQAVVIVSGIGTTNAAAATQHVIDRFAPERVINMGVVGCLNHAIPIGAVHAVSTCAFFDVDATAFGYKIGQIPQTEIHEYPLSGNTPQPLPTARLLSGDTFVTGRDGFHPELAGFEADFVDMELTAIAHTLLRNGRLEQLESYKAPSDYCDSDSPEAFEENLPQALRGLADVAEQILRSRCVCAAHAAPAGAAR